MLLEGDDHRELHQLLSNIMSITVAVVNLEYSEQVLPSPYQPVCIAVHLYGCMYIANCSRWKSFTFLLQIDR